MKKILISFALILMLSFVLVSASGESKENAYSGTAKCIVKCNNAKAETYSQCTDNNIAGIKKCIENYRTCFENAKKDFENKKISLKEYIKRRQDCAKKHLECIKNINSERINCIKKANENNRLCIKNCKELLPCTYIYNPVCGEDGKTYGNECFLKQSGTKKACDGECPCKNICYSDSDCKENQFCEFDKCFKDKCLFDKGNEKCPITDEKITGKCIDAPEICPMTIAPLIYQPVCGCDGKTYSNDCARKAAKVSKNHDGECKTENPEQVREQIKCVFKNSKEEQKCYTAEDNSRAGCSGTENCVAEIKGYKGEKITWKSSCGGYAYTTIDGENEYAEFKCNMDLPLPALSSLSSGGVKKI